jgi:serine/threonine protein phosphatase PrpC
VENVVREAMNRQSADNLSAVLVGLSGLEQEERALPKSKTLTGGEMKSFLREGKGRGLR